MYIEDLYGSKDQKEEEAAKWMTTHLINAESDILAK